jgi:hypothetical protein
MYLFVIVRWQCPFREFVKGVLVLPVVIAAALVESVSQTNVEVPFILHPGVIASYVVVAELFSVILVQLEVRPAQHQTFITFIVFLAVKVDEHVVASVKPLWMVDNLHSVEANVLDVLK